MAAPCRARWPVSAQTNLERLGRLLARYSSPFEGILLIGDRADLNDEPALAYDARMVFRHRWGPESAAGVLKEAGQATGCTLSLRGVIQGHHQHAGLDPMAQSADRRPVHQV